MAENRTSGIQVAMEGYANWRERMLPDLSGRETFWEHVYRYGFACRFVSGKTVLDIASGEGYGAAALRAAGAAHVTAVDICEDACRHAREAYGLDARVGSCAQIPVADASIDVVVSFETIEHLSDPFRFLDECVRVLKPGGMIVVSTPNKPIYSAEGAPPNPYHQFEMTEREFRSALELRFEGLKLYSQRPNRAPWWSLRSVAAEETPWNNLSLFRRLRQSARFRLAPVCVYDPSDEQRSEVVEEVLNARRVKYSFLIPFAVRPRRWWEAEEPFYFVATAFSGARAGRSRA